MTKRKIFTSPHDTYVRGEFGKVELARSYFQTYLPPEIAKLVDWSSLALAPSDFVDKALKNRKGDILYQVTILGRKGYFYLHLEHQRTPDAQMPYRLLVYMVRIWVYRLFSRWSCIREQKSGILRYHCINC